MRPDVYLSLTTGTWPSPFWLWYGDSVWRNGNDSDFCGEGSMRQQWINYRDVATQQFVVRRGPLFPLNALMNQGIMYARLGTAARAGNDVKDVVDEFRMFFGDGTQLQELYMTPQMMTPDAVGRPGRGGPLVARQRRRIGRYALDRRRRGQERALWLRVLVAAQGDFVRAQSQQTAADSHAQVGRGF